MYSKPKPKTGLAGRMRAWMRAQEGAFTKRDVYLGIGIDDPRDRATVRRAFGDFVRRGEVILLPPDRRRADAGRVNRYRYNLSWQRAHTGILAPRIYKAMYVSGTWAVTDIVRLTDLNRDWIDRVVRRLKSGGYIAQVGRRLCAHGAGAEVLYHVTDRDRFRLEVMR